MVTRSRRRLTLVGTRRITLDGETLSYSVKRSPVARHFRLEVRPESGLTVVIPRCGRLSYIPELLQEKRRWVLAKLCEFRQFQPRRENVANTVYYLGRELKLVKRNHASVDTVHLVHNQLIVSLRPKGAPAPVLRSWYQEQADKFIRDRVEKLSAHLGVTYCKMRIRSARTRWGSCSPQACLNFNWRLIMAPPAVIDYVVIHELVHLLEMNHSRRFWSLVAEYCPTWRENKTWLKDHQAELTNQPALEV